jgi:hypothetical protein
MRKVLGYVCVLLLIVGILLFVGSIVAFAAGLDKLAALYEEAKPILPFLLAGLGLIVFVSVLSSVLWPELWKPAGEIRCGKCRALKDGRAKFCDQCGAALGGGQSPSGIRDSQDAANPGAPANVWDQVRAWLGR